MGFSGTGAGTGAGAGAAGMGSGVAQESAMEPVWSRATELRARHRHRCWDRRRIRAGGSRHRGQLRDRAGIRRTWRFRIRRCRAGRDGIWRGRLLLGALERSTRGASTPEQLCPGVAIQRAAACRREVRFPGCRRAARHVAVARRHVLGDGGRSGAGSSAPKHAEIDSAGRQEREACRSGNEHQILLGLLGSPSVSLGKRRCTGADFSGLVRQPAEGSWSHAARHGMLADPIGN